MSLGQLGRLGAGFGWIGGGGISGPTITLSSATIAEDASVGDLVGTLAVSNGSGSYTFTLTDDAGGLFALLEEGFDDIWNGMSSAARITVATGEGISGYATGHAANR